MNNDVDASYTNNQFFEGVLMKDVCAYKGWKVVLVGSVLRGDRHDVASPSTPR